MQRHLEQKLRFWFKKTKRKPLVIRGARQVGKSTLVRLFAAAEGLTLIEVNLERHPMLKEVFKTNDVDKVLAQLSALPGVPTITGHCLLFLDEIQAVPEAIPCLRYFFEDKPSLPVIAAGSLLEFALREHNFSMPVGRIEYLQMFPMTFSEFLLALGEAKLLESLTTYSLNTEIGVIVHQRLSELQRLYMFVGGMPEAVETYVGTRQLESVTDVHASIVETYRDDFPKYCGTRNLGRVKQVFDFAAQNVGRKIKYRNISPSDQSASLKTDIDLLCRARVISKVIHSHCTGLPLAADVDEKAFKLVFLDIGLMNYVTGVTFRSYLKLTDRALIHEGGLAEQFIGQELLAQMPTQGLPKLHYWLREGRTNNAEVDFVVAVGSTIVPIEVKAGKSGTLKSLHQLMGLKSLPRALRFDLNPPSVQRVNAHFIVDQETRTVNYELISWPLYLSEALTNLFGL